MPPHAMEAMLLATGFTGALTLRWLFGLVFTRSGANVAAHFVPAGGGTDLVAKAIASARREVLLLANGFANRAVAQALVEARLRGVNVEILLDAGNETDPGSEMHFLVEQGLPPMLDDRPVPRNAVVIDGANVVAGCFTLAAAAEAEGSENLLVLQGDSALAGAFRQDILGRKTHARAVPPKTATAPEVVASPVVIENIAEPVATQASVDLMARLRQELGTAAEETPREKKKKAA